MSRAIITMTPQMLNDAIRDYLRKDIPELVIHKMKPVVDMNITRTEKGAEISNHLVAVEIEVEE